VLRRKLVAAVLCLGGAAAGVITLAGVTALRGALMRQTDQQLLAEAAGLARHAVIAWPGHGTGGQGSLCLEAFTPGGQSLLPSGLSGQSALPLSCGAGPAVPAGVAWLRAHAGRPVTVPGRDGGQSWRIITIPVHYRAHHIPYVYGASDYSLTLTAGTRQGFPAIVVIGVGLAGIGHDVAGLAITVLALSIVMIVAAAGIGAAAIRASLRPLAGIQESAEVAAEGGPPREAEAGAAGREFGRLAQAVTTITSRAASAQREQTAAESAAHDARERMRRALLAGLRDLREPLDIIAGYAEYYRQRARPGAGAPEAGATRSGGSEAAPSEAGAAGAGGAGAGAGVPGAMRRVADETARMMATVDALSEAAAVTGPGRPQPGSPGDGEPRPYSSA
jgi:signal transduction histidine kinase